MLANFKKGIPHYDIITDEQADDFIERALRILEKIGCLFRDDTAVAQWKDAGFNVDAGRVRFSADHIRNVIENVPGEYTHHARNQKHSAKIGGRDMAFGPAYGSPFIRDADGERRYGTMDDFHNLMKLTQMSPALNSGDG